VAGKAGHNKGAFYKNILGFVLNRRQLEDPFPLFVPTP